MSIDFLGRTLLAGAALFIAATIARAVDQNTISQPEVEHVAAIERSIGGRLGLAVIDTATGNRLEYRATERFPMCSTFKFLASAAVLQRVDDNQENLDRRISYSTGDLLEWAPVTKEHVQEGSMTLDSLCAAAIEYSDNTAANLLLQTIGGPKALTAYVRSLGDEITRLDRSEPSLNSALEGDNRDTTSPNSMLKDMQTLLIGDRLSPDSRQLLETWLAANTTGSKRLRAGFPPAWQVGDKTGTGANGAAGDIAIVRPLDRSPILIAVYFADSTASSADLDGAFAKLGRLVATWIGSISSKWPKPAL